MYKYVSIKQRNNIKYGEKRVRDIFAEFTFKMYTEAIDSV